MSGWDIVRTYIRQNRATYLIGTSLTAAASLLAVLVPWLLGRFADRLGKGNLSTTDAAVVSVLIAAICTIRIAIWWLGRIMIHRKGRMLTYLLRKRLFEKWNSLSPEYYHGQSIGDLLSHALSDVEVIREMVSMGINMTVTGISMLAAVFCMMIVHGDWRLTVAGLGPLLAIPLLVKVFGPRLKRHSQRCQEALGSMAQTVEETFGGIRVVKAFGNEQVVIERFGRKVDRIVDERVTFVRLSAQFEALIPLLANVGFIMVLGYGGYLCITGSITIGSFVAFTMYVAMLRNPLEHLGKVLNLVQRSAASLGRIALLLEVAPAVRNRDGELTDLPLRGELRVERLSFRYPGTGQDVLSDISFAVAPGKTVGIIGQMGSGKTTLSDLLLRLYDPPAGSVFIDGLDILGYPLERLRRGMAYVPQDGFLFSTTILENIAFSDESADLPLAEKSAATTALHETITRFPDEYATEIGERGVRLSGGQKQRLAIARMVYKDAPIRILDDSLSAVDTTTELQILKNLTGVGQSGGDSHENAPQTTIIISHRLSAVRHADEILVLEAGCIIERGRHGDLILENGPYARLWWLQSGLTEEEVKSLKTGRSNLLGLSELESEIMGRELLEQEAA
jgi:ATP-binding cassette, subfamily B, multidrug efflux pump